MKSWKGFVSVCMIAASAFGQEAMTNDAVVRMVKAGLGPDVVVGTINSRPGRFTLSPDDLIALKKAGVPDHVISAMVAKGGSAPVAAAAAAEPAPAATGSVTLRDGTPVRLRLARNLSSADARTGETVDFEVLEDVKVDDVVLIAHGSSAIGTVTQAEKKKRMARGGKLDVMIEYARLVNGDKAALRAVRETSGGGHTGAMTGAIVATALVAWPAAPFFLMMHGKDTTITKGTEITAYVNGDVQVGRGKLIAQR